MCIQLCVPTHASVEKYANASGVSTWPFLLGFLNIYFAVFDVAREFHCARVKHAKPTFLVNFCLIFMILFASSLIIPEKRKRILKSCGDSYFDFVGRPSVQIMTYQKALFHLKKTFLLSEKEKSCSSTTLPSWAVCPPGGSTGRPGRERDQRRPWWHVTDWRVAHNPRLWMSTMCLTTTPWTPSTGDISAGNA